MPTIQPSCPQPCAPVNYWNAPIIHGICVMRFRFVVGASTETRVIRGFAEMRGQFPVRSPFSMMQSADTISSGFDLSVRESAKAALPEMAKDKIRSEDIRFMQQFP